jgi:hypothetical protein
LSTDECRILKFKKKTKLALDYREGRRKSEILSRNSVPNWKYANKIKILKSEIQIQANTNSAVV